MKFRTVIWSVLTLVLMLAIAGVSWLTRSEPVLTVATWAGPYARAQANAMFRPYAEDNRVDVRFAEYDGGIDALRAQVTAHKYDWDVVDFELDDAVSACTAGLLERIDIRTLPPGAHGVDPRTDFVPGALGRCWVGSVVYSQVIAYASSRFTGHEPTKAADFFDLKRFPGPRALRRGSPKYNLELALLAEGVPPERIYSTLSTPKGLSRALRKLATIRKSIVWWTKSTDAVAMLENGQAAFATALNGDTYDALIHKKPIGVIWDRQLYELDVFGVPKGDPKRDMATDFVRYATGSKPLARVADWVPYGPARRSSLRLVGRNPETGLAMMPYLPTTPAHFATAFAIDDRCWPATIDWIAPRWEHWAARLP